MVTMFRALFTVHMRPQLKELYMFSVLFSFASALIVIFEPVYFYQQGFSLAMIALYYAVHYTLYMFMVPLGGKFIARYGLERSLAVSMPLFVVYFILLALLPLWQPLLWFAAVILACFKILYWPAYHAEFAKFGDGRNRGTELSWIYVIRWGVGIFGPLTGGLVITWFGYPVLFVMASIVVLLAVFPLLRTKERYRARSFSFREVWDVIRSCQHRRMVKATIGWGENLIDIVFWPIFAFLVLGSVDKLGFVASFSIFIMALLAFFIGELSDRFSQRAVLRVHVPFLVLGYLFRIVANTPLRVLLADTLARSANIGVKIPFWSRVYAQAKNAGPLRYVIAQEMVLACTKALVAFVLVVVFSVFAPPVAFTVAFIIAAVLSFAYLWL